MFEFTFGLGNISFPFSFIFSCFFLYLSFCPSLPEFRSYFHCLITSFLSSCLSTFPFTCITAPIFYSVLPSFILSILLSFFVLSQHSLLTLLCSFLFSFSPSNLQSPLILSFSSICPCFSFLPLSLLTVRYPSFLPYFWHFILVVHFLDIICFSFFLILLFSLSPSCLAMLSVLLLLLSSLPHCLFLCPTHFFSICHLFFFSPFLKSFSTFSCSSIHSLSFSNCPWSYILFLVPFFLFTPSLLHDSEVSK